jgi:hypothetical protein
MFKKLRVAAVDWLGSYHEINNYLVTHNLVESFTSYSADEHADIVLTTSADCNSRSAFLIRHARERGIPTLHIVDGVIKWRRVWSSSDPGPTKPAPPFQPIIADKVACIGPSQARLLSSWGQFAKVETTGLPRFDKYFTSQFNSHIRLPSGRQFTKTKRILVIISNAFAYNSADSQKVYKSLLHLNDFFASASLSHHYEITWRLSKKLRYKIPFDLVGRVQYPNICLFESLPFYDVVISLPSTAILESMSLGLPTCILDYLPGPDYIQAAWTMRNQGDIEEQIDSLLSANEEYLHYQHYLLHDQLRLDSPSTPRIVRLIQDMIDLAQNKTHHVAIHYLSPASASSSQYSYCPPYDYNPADLFPAYPLFARGADDEIISELYHLRMLVNNIDQELAKRPFFSRFRLRALLWFPRYARLIYRALLGICRRFFLQFHRIR